MITHSNGVVVFDIETIPSPEFLGEGPPEEFLLKGVSSNWKPETVETHKEKQREKWDDEKMKYGSLDWRLGNILAASILEERGTELLLNTAVAWAPKHLDLDWGVPTIEKQYEIDLDVQGVGTEEDLVYWMKDHLSNQHRVAGFNLRNFDLPWYYGRSAIHNVKPKRWVGPRYDPRVVTDWADILCNYGSFSQTGWTLARYAKHLNLVCQPWGEGSDVLTWMSRSTNGESDPDYSSIARHVTFDVLSTWALDRALRDGYI